MVPEASASSAVLAVLASAVVSTAVLIPAAVSSGPVALEVPYLAVETVVL